MSLQKLLLPYNFTKNDEKCLKSLKMHTIRVACTFKNLQKVRFLAKNEQKLSLFSR